MKSISKTAGALPVSAALAVDLRAKALIADGRDIVSFCVGEPDFDAPEAACRAGIRTIEEGGMRYTNASGTEALRKAISTALLRDCGVAYGPGEIAVTTGAKYAVYAALLALTDPGDEVILPAPYWTSYLHIIRLVGAVPVIVPCVPENGWKLTPEQLQSAVTENTKALILNNPNNPTGAVYAQRELSALAAVCIENDLYVVSDEIYSRLVYTDAPFCALASIGGMQERTVTVNGVSKAYAMTGWRIGYAAASPAVARAISALLSHTTGSPNTAAQAAAAEALLGPQTDTARMLEAFRRRRDLLMELLERVPGVRCSVPEGAFYGLLDIRALLTKSNCRDEAELALRLLEEAGVAAVPCGDYGAPGFLRLSYTLEDARMAEGIARLKRWIEEDAGHHGTQK